MPSLLTVPTAVSEVASALAPLGRTIRDRLDGRSIAGALLFTAILAWVFHQSLGSAVESLVSATLVGGSGLVAEAYGLRDEVQGLGFGVWMLVGGVALALFDPTPYVGELFAVGGAWLLLDNVQTLRHGGLAAPERDPDDGDAVYRQYLAERIRERLRERSYTRRELREAFPETPEAVDDALALLRDRGLVEREGSAFRARDPSSPGPVRRVLARLARPVTLELGADTDDSSLRDGRSVTSATDRPSSEQPARDAATRSGDATPESRERSSRTRTRES